MKKEIIKIEEIVKNEASSLDWECHLQPVLFFTSVLAEKLGANAKVVRVSALLHDIGRLRFGPKNHEITGKKIAIQIMEDFNFPSAFISSVADCIETHKNDKNNPPKTLEAEIIANADAMAHITHVPSLIYRKSRESSYEKTIEWVKTKVERDWSEKLTLPLAKELVSDSYSAVIKTLTP